MDPPLDEKKSPDSEMADATPGPVPVQLTSPVASSEPEKMMAQDDPLGPIVEDAQLEHGSGIAEHPQTGGKSQTIWNTIADGDADEGFQDEEGNAAAHLQPEVDWDASGDGMEELVDAPSTDIRHPYTTQGAFESVLNGPLEFEGSFYFHKTYTEFPNPVLRLDSLGHIGLPLSTREAKQIISNSILAPFGQGERTVVDKNVRDTWEMDASKVHFDNPAWKPFMNQVSQQVCLKLGLAAAQVSTFPSAPRHLKKRRGMFATIVVVLPSAFQGGAAHLSHGSLSTVIDSSSQSLTNLSILACGYRVALAFNLIQTANSLPKLPQTNDFLTRFRHVLLSWKQQPESDVPDKLIYLLQHKYSLASLRGAGNSLKGADAYKVALVESLAKELEFDVGLANVECHVTGYGDDHFGQEDSDEEVGMAEVESQTMSIRKLVALNGHHIRDEVECEEDDSEFCPENLREVVEGGDPMRESTKGYQGNGAGSLELWYRRTVLVIWLHRHNAEMVYGNNPSPVLTILASREEPDEECRLLVKFLLRGIESGRFGTKTIKGLCKTACRWKNLTLYLKTLGLCDGTKILDSLPTPLIANAVEVFGQGVQDMTAKMLADASTNTARFGLLDAIAEKMDSDWLARQRHELTRTLKKPIRGEEGLLVKLSVEGGGVPFLQTTILPQVLSTADVTFFIGFSQLLAIEQPLLRTEEHALAIQAIVGDLLKLAIENTDFSSSGSPALAYSFIEACIKCSRADLAELVIDKLTGLCVLPTTPPIWMTNVLMPLIPQLTASERPIPGLVKLCRAAVKNRMGQLGNTPPTDREVSAILDAIVETKDGALLPQFVKQMLLLPLDEARCRSLIQHFRSREETLTCDDGLSITNICTQVVQNLVQRTHYQSLSLIFGHFQLCLSTNNVPVLSQLFPRIFSPVVTNKRTYITDTLLPLVPKIRGELAGRNLHPASEPFGGAFKRIFELYASKVLGPKTSDHGSLVENVKKLSCSCTQSIGAPQRKHVEKNLAQFCGYRIANWSTIKSNPQGLQVNKSDLLYSSIVWTMQQTTLKEALGVVSRDQGTLREIFGEDYGNFMKALGEEPVEAGPPPAKKRRVTDPADIIDLCSP
ncbi:hypothetical protein B0H16DRAFT_1447812 [Mycena metata]|uniref:Uncharacterized protein n=1 Tax=Mycena metata TaxID=1033252 RepID=A0AAD7K9X0_9AGAR|nr:hypothetical protein B0H16DRAFT_1447812 [Mycena metata]